MDVVNNEENENIHLIRKESLSYDSTDKTGDDDVTRKKKINLKEAFYVMTSVSIGASVLLAPFTIRQLGLIPWVLCITVMSFAFTLCAWLLWLSAQRMMEEEDDIDITRDVYPSLAQFSYGRVVRIFTAVFLFAAALSCSIAFLLLSASILAELLPIGAHTHANCIRIWCVIIGSILTPITYLGDYSDARVPAVVAVLTALLSGVAILINCMIYASSTSIRLTDGEHKAVNKNMFLPIGTLIFAMCGVPYTISNITVLASTPQRLPRCIVGCNMCIYLTLLTLGLVPYLVFGEDNLSSTISTFYQVINSEHGGGIAFKIITIVLQTLMFIHVTMATVLVMNPVFLCVEDFLNVAHEFNGKRVIIRTFFMFLILGICVLVPQFDFAVSISGGVPFAIMTIFLPVVIYAKLFELPTYKKMLVFLFLIGVVIFVLGNLVVSILDVIER